MGCQRENDMKLSITLDTLTARILKLSSDSQSRIEPVPLYSRRKPTVAGLFEKISVNSKTVIKNDIWEWLE